MSYTDTDRLEFIMRRKRLPSTFNKAMFGENAWVFDIVPSAGNQFPNDPRTCIDQAMEREIIELLTS